MEGNRWATVTFWTGRRVQKSLLVSVFSVRAEKSLLVQATWCWVERSTPGERDWETFARPHRIAPAYVDDLGQGETCFQELPSGFWDSLKGGDINLKMTTVGAKFGSFAEWRALPNPALSWSTCSCPGILLPGRAGARCLAPGELWKPFEALLCHCSPGIAATDCGERSSSGNWVPVRNSSNAILWCWCFFLLRKL